jgi:hypothetical protein
VIVQREVACDRIHTLLSLADIEIRPEATRHHKWQNILMQFFRREDKGHRHLEDIAIGDARLENTHYRVSLPANPQRATGQFWIGAKMVPKLVSQNDNMVLPGVFLVRQKVPPQKKRTAKHAVIV